MVIGHCRSDFDSGRRSAGLSDANLWRHPDQGCALCRRQGQHHERPALHPAQRDRQDPRPRHSGRARLHQFARDPGRLCHRICPQGLRGAGAGPDRPRLQRSAGLRQRLRRPRRAGASAQPRHRRQEQYRARGPLDGRLDRARRRIRHAERLQVDGAGGILDRQALRRRGHRDLAAQRRAGVRAIRGIFRSDVGRRAGARRHAKPKTLGAVWHARARRTRQGLWRHRAGHGESAVHAGDHASGRAYFASGHRLQPRLVRQDLARRHAASLGRPNLVPQGAGHADRADRLCRAPARGFRRPARSARVFAPADCPRPPLPSHRPRSRPAAAAGPQPSCYPPSFPR